MSAASPSHTARLADADRLTRGEWFVVMSVSTDEEKRSAIEAALQETGRRHRFVGPEGGIVAACDRGARQAAAEGGLLVAAGGDGTLNAAAQAALRHGCPLGLVPMGTFNLFAREHGVPLEPAEAVRGLAHGRPEPVQVGLVNGRLFLVNAAVGLYPKLLEDRETAKREIGHRARWIAIAAGLVSLFGWRTRLTLDAEVDGRPTRLRTPSLFVCNNRVQLERVGIDEALVASVGHGRMVALVAHRMNAWAKAKLLVRAVAGRLGDADEIDAFALRSLDAAIRFARRVKVATDGEVQWMALPLRFTVSPQPLVMALPPRQEAPLA
jgi:diacylglycerol kinase family enzyme